MRTGRWHWRLAFAIVAVLFIMGFAAVRTNALGAADRLDRMMARIGSIIHPAPDRPTLPTIVVTPEPTASPTPEPVGEVPAVASATPEPTATPVPRVPVDMTIVRNHKAVFSSQLTEKMCAVAGTQMVLTILGLGNPSAEFQNELGGRIGEWEAWDDSHNGGWGPAAIAQALAAYGAKGYEVRAYESRGHALKDAAAALTRTGKPVVLLPWWGAHTWVMTGYRADADPTIFRDARVSGLYILDPWYPRVSSIWGPSDGPGNFEDMAEMRRNFIGWSRPEGAYPDRDGLFVVVLPTR
ncbi:MAG TPA: papain-like cysteine protease family protein [Candidatus Limnocylindria bacterium]|nr:papain-like cysteine protease family protein [Candidatus Limnocylindria bacterium]